MSVIFVEKIQNNPKVAKVAFPEIFRTPQGTTNLQMKASLFSPDTAYYFAAWSVLWVICLSISPGHTAINSSYRLNFVHGVLSVLFASLALLDYLPSDSIATTCTLSYFTIDFANILLNDFYFQVPSYQSPQNRRVEYCHHIFCLFVGLSSQGFHTELCSLPSGRQPFLYLMYAETSTPLLMAWRYTNSYILGGVFVVTFFLCRIVYHGFVFIPQCVESCIPLVGYGFAIPYNLLNLYFFYMIMRKVLFAGGNKTARKEH